MHVSWLFVTFLICRSLQIDHVSFLRNYGYLEQNVPGAQLNENHVAEALKNMQRLAGLEATGVLDEPTKNILQRPRCGRPDVIRNRRSRREIKTWKERRITFNVIDAGSAKISVGQLRQALHIAASQWSAIADIEIVEGRNALINVSIGRSHHNCAHIFRNNELAHAYPPEFGQMHVNDEVNFHMAPFTNQHGVSLPAVVTHEMGHTLGFEHSPEQDSIMFAYDLPRAYRFTSYDKSLVQHYYGKKNAQEEKKPGIHLTPTRQSPRLNTPEETHDFVIPDPCHVSNPIITFFRGEFFIFKSEWVWKLSRDAKKISIKPRPIEEVIRGLPSPVDAAVPVRNQLWVFIGSKVYVTDGQRVLYAPMSLGNMKINAASIDVAYDWHYFDPPSIYLWSGSQYWRLEQAMDHRIADERYPRPLSINWAHVPSGVSSAFTYEKEVFFVKDELLYRMNSSSPRFEVSAGYPIQLRDFWAICSEEKAEKLVNSSTTLSLKIVRLLFSLVLFKMGISTFSG